jgi:hypothetical protein
MSCYRNNIATLAGLTAALLLFPGAKSGCGSEESRSTWQSPVQAVATLLESSDGTVAAELVLISTARATHSFVDTAENVELRVPGGSIVNLDPDGSGHYSATSTDDPNLVYQAGERYRLTFNLTDEELVGDSADRDFRALADAPGDEVTFSFSHAPEFAGDLAELSWTPASLYALVTVEDADGELVWQNFYFETPQFEGDKWARLRRGGSMDLQDVFTEAGDYSVTLCAVERVSDFDTMLSADLGVLSGFLIGRCAAPQQITVPE